MILAHFFHSQSLMETIMWKHHSNSMMNMMNGNISITLYIISFTSIIGSSHSNQLSNLGIFISETGVSSPKDKIFKDGFVLVCSSYVLSLSQFHISVIFCPNTKTWRLLIRIEINNINFFIILSLSCNISCDLVYGLLATKQV
jgi:hypothetical protein